MAAGSDLKARFETLDRGCARCADVQHFKRLHPRLRVLIRGRSTIWEAPKGGGAESEFGEQVSEAAYRGETS